MQRFTIHLRMLLCSGAILASAAGHADQNDPRLEELFTKLQAATDLADAIPTEDLIWQIWSEHDDAGIESQMLRGIAQVNANDLQGALATFDRLVAAAPDFAEAWNKRATIHWLLGNHEASEADIVRTLQLEPFHFGALSGRGLVLMQQRRFEEARSAFARALEVHPNMPSVRANIEEITRYLDSRTI
ncbi:MAG TPA: tetratricopeptide repeat protein [Pseudomonadales bacterium]